MCGIVGELRFDGGTPDRGTLAGMVATLAHRGPDATGMHSDGAVGLAHARLSIIDLSGGAQPMAHPDGSLWITFNGEIFNYVELRQNLQAHGHVFATQSDTEVILHLYQRYGDECVRYLNGQWAFAIWDAPRRRLFLSRDRMGVRPLFYTCEPGKRFLFASEIKALFAHPSVSRALDLDALKQIFTYWVTLSPRTAFQGVSELPPGHSMVVENGMVAVHRHWALDYQPESTDDEATAEKRADELLEILSDATRIRLRADVPVGAYLSGGLDSTVITALIRRLHSGRLRTFSVSFSDPEFDERQYQREASAYLQTDHDEVCCGYNDIAEIFPDVVWHTETPVIRTAPAPLYLLSRIVRSSGFKVVLTGEGSDEVMGGYDIFKEAKIRHWCARHPGSNLRPLLLQRLYPYMKNLQRQSPAYLKSWFHASQEDLADPCFSHAPRWSLASKLQMLFSAETRAVLSTNGTDELRGSLPARYATWPSLCKAQYLESVHLLPGYILSSQGDRMAMANSVEGRYPFLDHRVVEFAARLHPNLKLKVLNEKYLLKRAAGELVPQSIRTRPKQPYRAPDGRSFFATKQEYVREMLSPTAITRNGIFDARAVSQLVDKFHRGTAIGVKDDMALVGVLSTQLVMDQFVNQFRKIKCQVTNKLLSNYANSL